MPIKLHNFREVLDWPPPSWLVEGMIQENRFTLLYGEPATGKSFLAMHIAFSVACGLPVFGKITKQGPIIYILGEGRGDVSNRGKAWREKFKCEKEVPCEFVDGVVDIHSPRRVRELVDAINQKHDKVSLIVIDTFARCFSRGDENSAKDVGHF